MEFIHPTAGTKDVIAVYKITFDDKWFYIGSSGDLQNRIHAWQTMLRDIKRVRYKKLRDIFNSISIAKLEVLKTLEPVPKNYDAIREWERSEILENYDNPLLLNTLKETLPSRPVSQLKGREIILFNSISDAAKHNNVCYQTMKNILNGNLGYYKGYIFKYA